MLEHRNEKAEEAAGGSDRALGLVFAVVFFLIAAYPALHGGSLRLWALGVAALFLLAAFLCPRSLAPLNKAWTRFGLLLHKVMNPLILGVIFFLVVLPIALVMRLCGKRPLALRRSATTTYWIPRNPPGPAPESFTQQF